MCATSRAISTEIAIRLCASAPQSVVGTTIALMADYGVPTLWGVDARTAANLAERLFFRIWSKSQERAA